MRSNVSYQEKNLDQDTKKMLSLEELAAVYKGIPRDNTIIVYCHRGCRTWSAFFALEWLGYRKIRLSGIEMGGVGRAVGHSHRE